MFRPKKEYNYTNRKEFERNFSILQETMKRGKLNFSIQAKQTAESLMKIKTLPNNRIDLNTVDEFARSTAHIAGNFENMANYKNEKK